MILYTRYSKGKFCLTPRQGLYSPRPEHSQQSNALGFPMVGEGGGCWSFKNICTLPIQGNVLPITCRLIISQSLRITVNKDCTYEMWKIY